MSRQPIAFLNNYPGLALGLLLFCHSFCPADEPAFKSRIPGTICPTEYYGQWGSSYYHDGPEQCKCNDGEYNASATREHTITSCTSCIDPIHGVPISKASQSNPKEKRDTPPPRPDFEPSEILIDLGRRGRRGPYAYAEPRPDGAPCGSAYTAGEEFIVGSDDIAVVRDWMVSLCDETGRECLFRVMTIQSRTDPDRCLNVGRELDRNDPRVVKSGHERKTGSVVELPHRGSDNFRICMIKVPEGAAVFYFRTFCRHPMSEIDRTRAQAKKEG